MMKNEAKNASKTLAEKIAAVTKQNIEKAAKNSEAKNDGTADVYSPTYDVKCTQATATIPGVGEIQVEVWECAFGTEKKVFQTKSSAREWGKAKREEWKLVNGSAADTKKAILRLESVLVKMLRTQDKMKEANILTPEISNALGDAYNVILSVANVLRKKS
jgi:hypothetical protein